MKFANVFGDKYMSYKCVRDFSENVLMIVLKVYTRIDTNKWHSKHTCGSYLPCPITECTTW